MTTQINLFTQSIESHMGYTLIKDCGSFKIWEREGRWYSDEAHIFIEKSKVMNIIFLDIDGVLNCQLFYTQRDNKHNQICSERVGWLNELCEKHNISVVISSTWRHSGLEYCRKELKKAGATFDIIDVTPSSDHGFRGLEIKSWIEANAKLLGKPYYDYKTYVIIDDDSDMLLWQKEHFFQTDTYSGLTPNTCYKIGRFFGAERFPNAEQLHNG